jgi:ribose/xylose/arabinose/galactoside ABC-type transport system permease subunit
VAFAQVWTNGDLQVFKVPEFQMIALGRVLGVPFQVWIMVAIVAGAALHAAQDRVRPRDPRGRR